MRYRRQKRYLKWERLWVLTVSITAKMLKYGGAVSNGAVTVSLFYTLALELSFCGKKKKNAEWMVWICNLAW